MLELSGSIGGSISGISGEKVAEILHGKSKQDKQESDHKKESDPHKQSDQPKKDSDQHKDKPKQDVKKTDPSEQTKESSKDAGAHAEAAAGAALQDEVNQTREDLNVRKEPTVPLTKHEFSKNSLKIFDKLDGNKDGVLSDVELTGAMQDKTYKNEDAQTIAALYKARSGLSKLSIDNQESPVLMMLKYQSQAEKGVSKNDLYRFASIENTYPEKMEQSARTKDWLERENNFSRIDENADGKLSKQEIEKAGVESKEGSDEFKAMKYLSDNYKDVCNRASTLWFLPDVGIEMDDVKTHIKEVQDSPEGRAINEVNSAICFTNQSQEPGVSYDLFSDKKNPTASISPEAIKQGTLGDCYFEAVLASTAKSRPEAIVDMIKDNRDGTYTVTFPGAPDQPITVKAPTEAELGVYNRASKYGTWANVLEKAYGEYRKNNETWFEKLRRPTSTPSDGSDGGGPITHPTELLTGQKTGFTWCDANDPSKNEEVARNLKEAFSTNPPKVVSAGTPGDSDRERLSNDYVAGHAYSVLGYREDGKGGQFVTVRNPWGREGKDGTSEMTVEEFTKTFGYYAIEGKNGAQ